MRHLGLTREQFRHIINCCRHVLINESTTPSDLKHFLVSRLGESLPDAAAGILKLDDEQVDDLRQEILNALQPNAGVAL